MEIFKTILVLIALAIQFYGQLVTNDEKIKDLTKSGTMLFLWIYVLVNSLN